jgi:hypothetical protein
MVSAPARAFNISARRIVALADEFLLLRAQMSAMQRQFESVLAEIAVELDAEPLSTDVEAIVSQRPVQQDNRSDLKRGATLGGTTSGAKAVSTASIETAGVVPHLTAPHAEELEAEMSDNSSDALILVRDTRAVPQTAPMRADDQAQSTEIDRPTNTIHLHEAGNSVGGSFALAAQQEAHGPASPFSYNAVVLGSRREQATQKSRRATATTTRRWVTATIAVVAAIAAVAAGSSFAML